MRGPQRSLVNRPDKETEAVAPIHSYTVTQAVFHAGFRTKLTTLGGAAGSAACMLQFANDRIRIGGVVGECPANTHGVLLVPTSPWSGLGLSGVQGAAATRRC